MIFHLKAFITGYQLIRMALYVSCFSGPSSVINMMDPLFELDPLFRRTFLLVVPRRAFGKVASSGKFAPVEIYTTLARILSEKDYITPEEVLLLCTFKVTGCSLPKF